MRGDPLNHENVVVRSEFVTVGDGRDGDREEILNRLTSCLLESLNGWFAGRLVGEMSLFVREGDEAYRVVFTPEMSWGGNVDTVLQLHGLAAEAAVEREAFKRCWGESHPRRYSTDTAKG